MERQDWTRSAKLALAGTLATAAIGGGCLAIDRDVVTQRQYMDQRAVWLAAGFKESQLPTRAEWEAGVTLDKDGRKTQPSRAPAPDRSGGEGGEGGGGGGGGEH